jgi:Fur family ferric uptake transcriptional regulator
VSRPASAPGVSAGVTPATSPSPWDDLPARLRASGLRWTPQRRTLLEVLAGTSGHVTGAELVERCRALDPATIPSTVYRTLDVLEDLGIVRHAHGVDGREEFHVLPTVEHGHLYCTGCHAAWEIGPDEARALVTAIERTRGFRVNLSHLSVAGLCQACADGEAAGRVPGASTG